MPRELRLQYPGAIYQILNRGDQRDDIYLNDEDRSIAARAAAGTLCLEQLRA
jgi:hypothetical protein